MTRTLWGLALALAALAAPAATAQPTLFVTSIGSKFSAAFDRMILSLKYSRLSCSLLLRDRLRRRDSNRSSRRLRTVGDRYSCQVP